MLETNCLPVHHGSWFLQKSPAFNRNSNVYSILTSVSHRGNPREHTDLLQWSSHLHCLLLFWLIFIYMSRNIYVYRYNVYISEYYYYCIISIYINSNLYVVFNTFDSQNLHIYHGLYTWDVIFLDYADQ